MATIGIMSYGMPPNLKLKNAFNKITITTTNNGSNNVGILSDSSSNKLVINSNTIVKKIKDFGMIGIANKTGAVIMRKKQKLVPLNESSSENISQGGSAIPSEAPQPPAKKFKISTKSVETKSAVNHLKIVGECTTVGIPGRKGLPAPQAVARRNARERNRVKQVNNGFAALRQHIPEEIAKAFEAVGGGNNRGSAKKLSKVETLRMAVEYIRGLEKLLGYEIPPVSPLSADEGSFTVIKDEFGPSSPMNDNFDNFDDSNGDDQDLCQITDNLPNITTLNGLQYIRIPGTNTYQLLTADIFGNEENFSPLIDVNCFPNGDDITDVEIPVSMLAAVAPASTPSVMSPPPPTLTTTVTSPLSPTTSSSLLSPAAGGILLQPNMSGSRGNNEHYMMPPQFQTMNDAPHHHAHRLARVKVEPSDIVYHLQEHQHQHLLGNSSPHLDSSGQGYYITTSSGENSSEEHSLYEGVVRLKKELNDVILDTSTAALSDESMMDAIDWWEANTPKSEGGTLM